MLNVVVFAEAASDAEIVCGLADRVFVEIGNIAQEKLPECRYWRGHEPNTTFIQKDRIVPLFDGLKRGNKRPRNLGYISGNPQKSHAAFWRKAIQLVVEIRNSQPVEVILIHHDVDNKPERREGIEQACSQVGDVLKVVLALPDREIEAWLLNGFVQENHGEEELITKLKRKLKFDPCMQADRARGTDGDRDPKNILSALTNDDDERKRRCWSKTPLTTLKQRGGKTNLTEFLNQVETLLPLDVN